VKKRTARRVLNDWIRRVNACEVAPLVKCAETPRKREHCDALLAFDIYRISTGSLEVPNSKFRLFRLKRRFQTS